MCKLLLIRIIVCKEAPIKHEWVLRAYNFIADIITPKADPSTPSIIILGHGRFFVSGGRDDKKGEFTEAVCNFFLSDIPTNPSSSLYIKRIHLAIAFSSLRTTKRITVNLMINSHKAFSRHSGE